ncbi:Uncharacterised protein [Acidipropionibacterium jensenii]|uniref:Cyanate permease n=1 Tax=Acidipropionibacterium jensenii TaxID=1749 RepID=A0A448NVN0_9ACTN|nr:Uncharacterised protein [Acidipropionibacterium jensenii]
MTMEMAVRESPGGSQQPERPGSQAGGSDAVGSASDRPPSHRPPRRDLAASQVSALMRTALVWAVAGGLVGAGMWGLFGPGHLDDLVGSVIGSALAVLFLWTGRSVHLLVDGGSMAGALILFVLQVAVLGVLGTAVISGDLLARLGTGPMPVVTTLAGVAVTWTVGVVVAARRPHQRIYRDPEDR